MNLAQAILASPVDPPFVPAPRLYTGCMGRIVPGVPFIEGAYAENPELVFSWLLHRYPVEWQAKILQFFRDAGDEDFLLSWADFDGTPEPFGDLIRSVRDAGLRPLVMLTAKTDPSDLAGLQARVGPVLPELRACGVPRVCVGWELNSWISPETLQAFIDWLAPQVQPAYPYVHFTEGYAAWQPNGLLFADFWRVNVNKLRGVLHQKVMTQTDQDYQTGEGGLRDILIHFADPRYGITDSGDGTPFDLVAFEVDLEMCSDGRITEAEMHRRARVGTEAPPVGAVRVQGSGCGL